MTDRVNGVDGLRAVAMTMVVAQHCGLLPFGWVGVWIFYVISGYVITRGFIVEDIRFPQVSKFERFVSFLKRRAIRIFPAYFGYIFLTIVAFYILNGSFSGQTLWGVFTFTYNWQMILGPIFPENSWSGIGHLWTLSVEQQFYLIFPVLFLFLPATTRWCVMLALVLAGPLVRYVYDAAFVVPNFSSDIGHSAFSIYASSFCHFDAFLIGGLLAKNEDYLTENAKVSAVFFAITGVAIITYGLFYIDANINLGAKGIDILRNIFSGYLYGQYKQIWLYSVINLFTLSVFLMIFIRLFWIKWLSNRWLAWVGKVSYGGYLLHIFILWMFQVSLGVTPGDYSLPTRVLFFCFIWLVTVAFASLSFKFFELPISNKLKKWATPYA